MGVKTNAAIKEMLFTFLDELSEIKDDETRLGFAKEFLPPGYKIVKVDDGKAE